jgi:hypothetical protein
MECVVCLKKHCICQKIIDHEINEIGFLETKPKRKKVEKIELSIFRAEEKQELKYKKRMLSGAKQRAKAKGLTFDLTLEDIHIPIYCPILGMPLYTSELDTDCSPSIDRIDNSGGYTKDNIQIISTRANRIKSDSSIEELQRMLNYLVEQKRLRSVDSAQPQISIQPL